MITQLYPAEHRAASPCRPFNPDEFSTTPPADLPPPEPNQAPHLSPPFNSSICFASSQNMFTNDGRNEPNRPRSDPMNHFEPRSERYRSRPAETRCERSNTVICDFGLIQQSANRISIPTGRHDTTQLRTSTIAALRFDLRTRHQLQHTTNNKIGRTKNLIPRFLYYRRRSSNLRRVFGLLSPYQICKAGFASIGSARQCRRYGVVAKIS